MKKLKRGQQKPTRRKKGDFHWGKDWGIQRTRVRVQDVQQKWGKKKKPVGPHGNDL